MLKEYRINGKAQVLTGCVIYEGTPEYLGAVPVVEKMGRKRSGGPMRRRKP